MKGISHFITGVAIATFFPEVVQQAAAGSLLPVLGGIGGILPDTLDFKFARYFERYDLAIDPGPEPDAGTIAAQLAGAMRRAYEAGRPQKVMLHTIRLGADRWRQYAVRFDPARGEVAVRVGPVVSTAGAALPGSAPEGAEEARVEVGVPLVHTYDAETRVEAFSGPSFTFERRGDRLYVHFLDWHRRWSHSLALVAALGAAAAGIAAAVEFLTTGGVTGVPLWVGLVVSLGVACHVLKDQLGYMGSNLLWPFARRRMSGLKVIHSGDAIPNFLAVWVSVALILFNLDRFSARPVLDPWWFLGLAVALPLVVLGAAYFALRARPHRGQTSPEAERQADMVAEVEEVEVA